MPEPGIADRNFNHPTTDRNKPRRRKSRPRIKLPGEYAEFRLSDGRYLGEVMGNSFFGPESGAQGGRPISDSERQRIRDGNYPFAGMFGDAPHFRSRPAAGEIAPPDPADPAAQTQTSPLPPMGDGRQSESSEQAMPRETDYWLDGSDLGPVSGGPAQFDNPVYLMPGQARFHDGETNTFERIGGAAAMAVSELFEGPYGIAHEDLGPLVNQSREDTLTPVFGTVRGLNEILIEGGTQLGDLALRTAAAPFVGGISAVGQAAIESGMTPTWARRLVRDLYIMGEVGTVAGAANPMVLARHGRPNQARSSRSPDTFIHEENSSRVLDRHIKQLPPGQREVTKRRLQQSYDEGQRAARKEIELRDLGGAEQAANPPSVIRRKVRDLVDFVQRNRSSRISRGKPERVWFGRVSDSRANELRKQLKQDYGIDYDLRGAVHRIDEDSVRRILGGHSTDQLPFTSGDFELIPEIVDTGSLISNTKRSGRNRVPAIVYRKLIGDWYYVVEEVQKKGQVLSVQSAYKTPAPKRNP